MPIGRVAKVKFRSPSNSGTVKVQSVNNIDQSKDGFSTRKACCRFATVPQKIAGLHLLNCSGKMPVLKFVRVG
jgi:hypothetical protein